MNKIKQFFKFLNDHVSYILLAVIAVMLFLYSIERTGRTKLNDNVIVSKDSVKYLKNKNKELYAQVNTYVITEKQLKEVNKELYNEVNKLKNQKPLVIVKEKVKIDYRDTTLISSISEKLDKDGNKLFNIPWSKDTSITKGNYFKLSGSSYLKIDSTLRIMKYGSKLNSMQLGTNLFLSVTENKEGKLLINARTDFPGLTFTEMEGYVIDPSKIKQLRGLNPKKRFGLSFFGGVGSIVNGSGLTFGPTIGIGLSYDLISF